MSHEVIQVIKQVKYNRKPHEMISVTCKRIPATVNKEMHKNEYSHKIISKYSIIKQRTLTHSRARMHQFHNTGLENYYQNLLLTNILVKVPYYICFGKKKRKGT